MNSLPPDPQSDFISENRRAISWSFLALYALIGFLHLFKLGILNIDDAYIFYRYAANLAQGNGLVYNAGERVQGFTSPLFTLVLGALAAIGLPLPAASTTIGAICAIATAGLLLFFYETPRWRIIAGITGLAFLLNPAIVLNSLSGMETLPYCALIILLFLTFERDRLISFGVAAAFLLLMRPDGAAWIIPLLAFLAWQHRLKIWRALLPLALIYGAWLLFASIYYGSPIPHSIAAKQLIHPSPLPTVLWRYVYFFIRTPELILLLVFALIGITSAAYFKQRNAMYAVAAACYLAGLTLSGIYPLESPRYFLWYAIPLIPVLVFYTNLGIEQLVSFEKIERRRPVAIALVILPLLFAIIGYYRLHTRELPAIFAHFQIREASYQHTARIINRQAGERRVSVLVGETGVLGYHLLRHHVYDSSGINAIAPYNYRLENRRRLLAQGKDPGWEGSIDWMLEFLREKRPDYVATKRPFLFINELEKREEFRQWYQPVPHPAAWQYGNTLWRRKDLYQPGNDENIAQ